MSIQVDGGGVEGRPWKENRSDMTCLTFSQDKRPYSEIQGTRRLCDCQNSAIISTGKLEQWSLFLMTILIRCQSGKRASKSTALALHRPAVDRLEYFIGWWHCYRKSGWKILIMIYFGRILWSGELLCSFVPAHARPNGSIPNGSIW